VDHGSVLRDPGCYEERYRLTRVALVAAALLLLGFVLTGGPISIVFGVLIAIPAVLALAGRPVAFRADHAGITLGSAGKPDSPLRLLRHRPAVFVPWADVEQIILYTGYRGGAGDPVLCIGIRRREGAPALPYGNEHAAWCPVPGVAAGATRPVNGWRLDREQLTAVTAAAAPGIPIVEAGTGPGPNVAGPGRTAAAPELGPAD
jgi:hypothetical protein